MYLELFKNYWWQYLILIVGCYLFASINYSVIFSNLFKKSDIRKHGSGNAGTTNMFRVFGLPMGIATFSCDFAKGVIATLVAKLVFKTLPIDGADTLAVYLAGLFTVIGHVYPVFFGFSGGKGVASTLGVCIVAHPLFALIAVVPFIVSIFIWDTISLSSLVMCLISVTVQWFRFPTVDLISCIAFTLMILLVLFAHRQNIARLLKGTEPRTGLIKKIKSQK